MTIVFIGGLNLNLKIRLVIVIVMLPVPGDPDIPTFLIMNPLRKGSILKRHGLPPGTTTVAVSGRKENSENSEMVFPWSTHPPDLFLFYLCRPIRHCGFC